MTIKSIGDVFAASTQLCSRGKLVDFMMLPDRDIHSNCLEYLENFAVN